MDDKIEISSDFMNQIIENFMIKAFVSIAPSEVQKPMEITLKAFQRNGVEPTTAFKIMKEIVDELGKDEDDTSRKD